MLKYRRCHDVAKLINQQLDKFLLNYKQSPEIYIPMEYVLTNGGKRYRPYLLYTLCSALNLNLENALHIGAALEMLHSYTLVHDDLPAMDDDDMRRGVPCCHKKFSESTAILTGDALQGEAFYWLSSDTLQINLQQKIDIINVTAFTMGANNLILGQLLDLSIINNEATFEQIQNVNLLKTAKLISLPFIIGFILADLRSKEEVDLIKTYGETLGLIFQIVDDYKDIDQKGANIINILGKQKVQTLTLSLNEQASDILDKLSLSDLKFLNNDLVSKIHV